MRAEPSWRTVATEAESARRHAGQAVESLSRLASEVAALREWEDARARLAVARRLCEGPDGGLLAALVAAASEEAPSAAPGPGTASLVLSRLTEALGLRPIASRGEVLALSAEELGELDVRGLAEGPSPGGRGLYRVIRPGWWLGPFVVERPLVEAVGKGCEALGETRADA